MNQGYPWAAVVCRNGNGIDPRWYVFHWPNNTPAERAKLTEVEIKGPVQIL
jgi:hypothetical protein